MGETGFGALCRDVYAYYSSPAVQMDEDKLAVMLRATGEPWTSYEIEQAVGTSEVTFDQFSRLATAKYLSGVSARTTNGARQALVDDYGNVINLSVAECKEIVEAFKALIKLRGLCDDNVHSTTVPAGYFRHVISSTGDPIPDRYMDILMSQFQGVNQRVSLRSLLKLMSRRE